MFAWNQNHCFSRILPGMVTYTSPMGHYQRSMGYHQSHLQEAYGWETCELYISFLESTLNSLAWYWRSFSLVCICQLTSYCSLYPLAHWADVLITSFVNLHILLSRPWHMIVVKSACISPVLRILLMDFFSIDLMSAHTWDKIRSHFLL